MITSATLNFLLFPNCMCSHTQPYWISDCFQYLSGINWLSLEYSKIVLEKIFYFLNRWLYWLSSL